MRRADVLQRLAELQRRLVEQHAACAAVELQKPNLVDQFLLAWALRGARTRQMETVLSLLQVMIDELETLAELRFLAVEAGLLATEADLVGWTMLGQVLEGLQLARAPFRVERPQTHEEERQARQAAGAGELSLSLLLEWYAQHVPSSERLGDCHMSGPPSEAPDLPLPTQETP